MTAKHRCLNKLADQYNYTYHHSIRRKCIIAHYSAVIEKIETNSKTAKSKVNDRVIIINNKNLWTNPGTCKNKDLNIENIIESSSEEVLLSKEVLLIKLYMSYHQESDSYIR